MLIELLLFLIEITPYLIIFVIFEHFRYIINIISEINVLLNRFNEDETTPFDVVVTPAKAVEQSNKN